MAVTSRPDVTTTPPAGGGSDRVSRDELLRAAFAPNDVARRSWEAVAARLDLYTLPFELHSLFPRIAARLRDFGIDSPDLPRFDGIRKRLWSQNALRGRAVAGACATLAGNGVEPLLTGGIAVLLYGADWGARPLTEVDLAVPHVAHQAAVAALSDAGWRVDLRRRDGFLLDMRASVLTGDLGQVTVRSSPSGWPYDGLPAAAVLDVAGSPLAVASRADVLLFVVADADRLPGYPPARRLADALALCDRSATPGLDWTAFVRRAGTRKAAPEAAEFLGYLSGRLCAPVPGATVEQLAVLAGRTGPLARRIDSAVLDAYRRRCRGGSPVAGARMLPRYLCEIWDVDDLAGLPAATLGHLGGSISRRLLRGRR